MTEIKRFTFRLPEDIFKNIEEIAKQNRRSVNAEIIIAIEQYLKANQDTHTEKTE